MISWEYSIVLVNTGTPLCRTEKFGIPHLFSKSYYRRKEEQFSFAAVLIYRTNLTQQLFFTQYKTLKYVLSQLNTPYTCILLNSEHTRHNFSPEFTPFDSWTNRTRFEVFFLHGHITNHGGICCGCRHWWHQHWCCSYEVSSTISTKRKKKAL